MAQIFFKKAAARPSAFATLGLTIVFLALVALLGAGPVLGLLQPNSPVPTELFLWRLKLLDLSNLLLLAGSSVTILAILHGRLSSRVRTSWRGFLAVAIALIVAMPLWFIHHTEKRWPPLHDVTTNVEDPPYFEHLTERSYSPNTPYGMKGGRLDINYQRYHESAYKGLATLELDTSFLETYATAKRVAEQEGWTIESSQKAMGKLEATYIMPVFGLRSNLAIRVRSVDAGKRSVLDIRSVSLLGVSDYGINAHLIKTFLEAVSAASD